MRPIAQPKFPISQRASTRTVSTARPRLLVLLAFLCLGACVGDDEPQFPIAIPQNELAICRLERLPSTDEQIVIDYGRVEDEHKLSFGYARDRLSVALANAGFQDFQIFEVRGGFAILTRSRWINPDGSKWTFLKGIPAKFLGWTPHKQAFLFVVSDTDQDLDQEQFIDLSPVDEFIIIQHDCKKTSINRLDRIQKKTRTKFNISVLSYVLTDEDNRWAVDKKFDISVVDQLIRSGIDLWPF